MADFKKWSFSKTTNFWYFSLKFLGLVLWLIWFFFCFIPMKISLCFLGRGWVEILNQNYVKPNDSRILKNMHTALFIKVWHWSSTTNAVFHLLLRTMAPAQLIICPNWRFLTFFDYFFKVWHWNTATKRSFYSSKLAFFNIFWLFF